MESSKLSRQGVVLLALLTLAWGFNWPIMKVVLREVAPLTFRGFGLLAGGLGVLVLTRLSRQTVMVPSRYWSRLAALSACNVIGWNVLVIYGVGLLPSGRAALLGYTMPIWGVLLSVLLLDETLTRRRIVALLLGIGGVLVLMSADVARLATAWSGVALTLAAAFSWGLGTVLLKRFALPIPTVALTGWTMLIGALPIIAGALIFERDRWHAVSLVPGSGVLYNVVVSFMFGYWAWNRIVLMVPVAVSSLSSLATPVVGVLSGMWLLGEPLTWHELVAGASILAAITLVLRGSDRGPALDAEERAA